MINIIIQMTKEQRHMSCRDCSVLTSKIDFENACHIFKVKKLKGATLMITIFYMKDLNKP